MLKGVLGIQQFPRFFSDSCELPKLSGQSNPYAPLLRRTRHSGEMYVKRDIAKRVASNEEFEVLFKRLPFASVFPRPFVRRETNEEAPEVNGIIVYPNFRKGRDSVTHDLNDEIAALPLTDAEFTVRRCGVDGQH